MVIGAVLFADRDSDRRSSVSLVEPRLESDRLRGVGVAASRSRQTRHRPGTGRTSVFKLQLPLSLCVTNPTCRRC